MNRQKINCRRNGLQRRAGFQPAHVGEANDCFMLARMRSRDRLEARPAL
jgi:hypothetical protein